MNTQQIREGRELFKEKCGYYPERAGLHTSHLNESSPYEVEGMEVVYAHIWQRGLKPNTLYFKNDRNEVVSLQEIQ